MPKNTDKGKGKDSTAAFFPDTSLIILTWNEREAIANIWDRIPFDSVAEAFFVDPGSDDGTIEFIRGKGRTVHIQEKTGRGNAFRLGMERAR